jgi:hypothetical protein
MKIWMHKMKVKAGKKLKEKHRKEKEKKRMINERK